MRSSSPKSLGTLAPLRLSKRALEPARDREAEHAALQETAGA